jgi:alkylation response protein AidB-like acyl-CoA dehydrogenase
VNAAAVLHEHDDDSVVGPLIESVERFCHAEICAPEIDRSGRIPADVLNGLAELGLFGITLPELYGGAGLSLHDACRVVSTLARYDRSVATTLGLHLGLGTRALVAYGGAQLKARYLPRLSRGDAIAAFATTEPNAGSDLSSLATSATQEGSDLVINGRKLFVTNGGIAQVYTLTVATPGLGGAQRGTSLLVVERSQTGFSVGREEQKLGLKGSSTTPLQLDEVRVGVDRIIGEPGRGTEQIHHVLAWGRTLMSAGCCGTARSALRRAIEHTSARRQFGKALDAQPVVREQLAAMVARLFAMESLVQDTARLEADLPALQHRSVAAKVLCSEGASHVVDMSLQLHGGLGFIEETGLPLLMRDVRVTRIFEGANDVLLSQLGAAFATSPRPRPLLRRSVTPRLVELAERADALAKGLNAARTALAARCRVGLLQKGRLLHRLGRAVMWSEAVDAAVRAVDVQGPAAHALADLVVDFASAEIASALVEPVDDTLLTRILEQAGARA